METYYSEMLKKVQQLIQNGDFKDAYSCIENELSMPYIPRDVEEQLIDFEKEARQILFPKNAKMIGEEELTQLLIGSEEQQCLAIEHLRTRNVRNFIDELQKYLLSDSELILKAFVIELLMEQNVSDELVVYRDELEVHFTPCAIVPITEQEGFNCASALIKDWFENDNPSFYMMCVDTLLSQCYLYLPLEIEKDDALSFALFCVKKVYDAHEDVDGYKLFLRKNNYRAEDYLWSI